MTRQHGTSRPDFWEVFPPTTELTSALSQVGWLASEPWKFDSWDKWNDGVRKEIVSRLERERPRLILLYCPVQLREVPRGLSREDKKVALKRAER
jgi:hypothetical protein